MPIPSAAAETPAKDEHDPRSKTLPQQIESIFNDANDVELLSLFWVPLDDSELPAAVRNKKRIDGFPILGRTNITDRKRDVIDAIKRGVAENQGDAAACFDPRHAVIARTKDGRTANLIICFECLNISATVAGGERFSLYTSAHASTLLDELLRRAKIKPYTPPKDW